MKRSRRKERNLRRKGKDQASLAVARADNIRRLCELGRPVPSKQVRLPLYQW